MRVTAPQIILLILLVLLLFGANRLPSLAKNVGQSLKIFKKEMSDLTGDDRTPAAPPAPPAPPAAAPQTSAHAPDPVTGTAPEAGTDVPPPPAPPRA